MSGPSSRGPPDGGGVQGPGFAGGGGGGAGGFLTGTGHPVTGGTSYTITVGAGGAGVYNGFSNGVNGANSVFDSLTAI